MTAHAPAGYVLARLMPPGKGLLIAALAGSLLPDLDLAYGYLVDGNSVHHHRYWTHVPLFWAALAAVVLPAAAGRFRLPAIAFFAAIVLHLLLDTIAGGIMWAAPVDDRLYRLVRIPPGPEHWLLTPITHWTFLLELVIWGWAAALFAGGRGWAR